MYKRTSCCPHQWRIQDLHEVEAPTLQWGRQHTILPNFAKNCMKLKEFGPGGGPPIPRAHPLYLPLLMAYSDSTYVGAGPGPGPEWVTIFYVKPSHCNLCGNLNRSYTLALCQSWSHISSV